MSSKKNHGRVYTPHFLVKIILDFGKYHTSEILQKHVIDNSCGDGAFLKEIVNRYCEEYLQVYKNLSILKHHLSTYIHGIELDENESKKCRQNLDLVVERYGITNVNWDIQNANTLYVTDYDNKMDYVFGNPPYVRVHNLNQSYDNVKKFDFADKGMTDLYLVFFEIGLKMLNDAGILCLITPSSWINSKAGLSFRKYIVLNNCITGVVDLGHLQPFNATTYTMISRLDKSTPNGYIEYYSLDSLDASPRYISRINLSDVILNNQFVIANNDEIKMLKDIMSFSFDKRAVVKNGFATLADSVFIGNFDFDEYVIDVIKASTGMWKKCIYPYDENGKPINIEQLKDTQTYKYLLKNKDVLTKTSKDLTNTNSWFLYGRTQAINDVSKPKYAINSIIKDIESIKLNYVGSGKGVYSGLYILTNEEFDLIKSIVCCEEFIKYIKALRKYKSGGYYTFSSKELEAYINYKLSLYYGQQRIPCSSSRLF